MTTEALRIARVLHGTTAEGPGLRTAVWFQGCSIRCRGCINPHLFSPNGGNDMTVSDIVLTAVASGVEGLTLIGGEPFDQPAAGAKLASEAQVQGLGVIAFSGYEYETLRNRDRDTKRFLAGIDLLVDGPYQAWNQETDRALVGSTNQRFIHISDRYRSYSPETAANRVDIRVLPDGSVDVAGFLDRSKLNDLLKATRTTRKARRANAK
ncbi:radical SAM protein [Pseudarthrobacter phenanthrenivorans]|uniref:4Fe-4S single cluster domain-containing protein n=1 Tax=Pseudarthrobacter phenanthrenivorans TaxID=361575 RepID=UPI0011293749|nr:4Fe-4S single cluster domain-containing protein [Pseudarthrobacter phenanthrenivorans]TPV48563.1 radical SAM protein [Pseudarthrobacter phenanthrenivorans]